MATIGETIKAYETAVAADSTAAAALKKATDDKTAAEHGKTTSTFALKTALQAVGPAFQLDAANAVKVYVPDQSPDGFTVITPSPADTPVPEPAPAP